MERSGLSFEEGFDDLVGIHEGGRLVAVAARAGNILKMFAVEPSRQGGELLAELMTELVRRGVSAGFPSLFVFTKPEHVTSFQSLNFSLLANQGEVALLEFGGGLERWLSSHRSLVRDGTNGAVVMNCNPFTRGHRHLVESASRQVDHLYLFVVAEERSLFPFPVRLRLVCEGVADLGNVLVLDTSCYAISNATFPTYFLKRDDPVARIQMELDLTLFASRIAPFFRITRRFAGDEPCCGLTYRYNQCMKHLLPPYGITLTEVERLRAGGEVISASRVRETLARDDRGALELLVPESTLAFLDSGQADSIRDNLRHKKRNTR
jgi:[citrate (pro-3S)-lyase] ligase